MTRPARTPRERPRARGTAAHWRPAGIRRASGAGRPGRRPVRRRRRSSAAGHRWRKPSTSGRRYEMKKITIRKVGPVRLTAAACSIYKNVN
ncbi:hypothetical protein Sru01_23360 [Sphaerisporangium rufum]|uniref:Uncharacterized protein n=1 Tax=Sphaerisporangium rufum TaxID=1381558 RepID=A0A919UZ28_9ACTN|nr:hypothetical protein Sru01_23360 [Sphaerisporangium rufum]